MLMGIVISGIGVVAGFGMAANEIGHRKESEKQAKIHERNLRLMNECGFFNRG